MGAVQTGMGGETGVNVADIVLTGLLLCGCVLQALVSRKINRRASLDSFVLFHASE